MTDKEAIEKWRGLTYEDKLSLVKQRYLGVDDIIKRFVETGCYSAENPNHNTSWCSCGKPFCYECVANQILNTIAHRLPPELKVLSEDELLEFLNIPLDAKAYKYAKTQLAWARVGAVAQLADDRRAVKGEK